MINLETKKVIRKQLLKKRSNLSEYERKQFEKEIFYKVIKLEEYQKAKNILLYANYGTEVSTEPLLEYSHQQGKRIFYPKVLSDTKMEFLEVLKVQDLKEGFKGISEPIEGRCFSEIDCGFMILPMVGFDNKKNRLGYGKGYYDRYLGKNYNILTCGIAFACQEYTPCLPTDINDYRLDMIVTEKIIY